MGDRGKMGKGWKLSCLEAVQDKVPEETQVNRFTPQNMMDLRQLCGDECGLRNTGNTVRSNLPKIIGFDLRLKTHTTMRAAIIVMQRLLDEPAHGAHTDNKFRIVITPQLSLLSIFSTLGNR